MHIGTKRIRKGRPNGGIRWWRQWPGDSIFMDSWILACSESSNKLYELLFMPHFWDFLSRALILLVSSLERLWAKQGEHKWCGWGQVRRKHYQEHRHSWNCQSIICMPYLQPQCTVVLKPIFTTLESEMKTSGLPRDNDRNLYYSRTRTRTHIRSLSENNFLVCSPPHF